MSTAANNGSTYAYISTTPTGNFQLIWAQKIGPGVINHTDFGIPFEVNLGGDYLQLYTDQFAAEPQYRRFQAWGGDSLLRAAGTFVDVWLKHRIERISNVWTLYVAEYSDTSWTSVGTFSSSDPIAAISFFASHVDLGDYVLPGGSIRSARMYVGGTAHAAADLLADLDSPTPTLGNLWAAWFDGASANLTGADTSGNGRNTTVVNGPFTSDSDDPVSSSGGTEDVDTEEDTAFSEANSAVAVLSASVSFSYEMEDLPSVGVALPGSATTETSSSSDSETASVVAAASLSYDTGSMSDSFSSSTSVAGSMVDSFDVDDAVDAYVDSVSSTTTDSYSLGDTSSAAIALPGSISENVSLTDEFSGQLADVVDTVDAFGIGDQVSVAIFAAADVNESFVESGSVSGVVGGVDASTYDVSEHVDEVTTDTEGVDNLGTTDDFSLSDSQTASSVSLEASVEEDSQFDDAYAFNTNTSVTTHDTYATDDNVDAAVTATALTTDAYASIDAHSCAINSISASVTDQSSASDTMWMSSTGTDDVGFEETMDVSYSVSGMTNTSNLVDASTAESVTMTDAVQGAVVFGTDVVDACAMADVISVHVVVNSSCIDTYTSQDSTSAVLPGVGLTLAETMVLQDTLSVALGAINTAVLENVELQFFVGSTSYDGVPVDAAIGETFSMTSSMSLGYQAGSAVKLTVKVRAAAVSLVSTVKEVE